MTREDRDSRVQSDGGRGGSPGVATTAAARLVVACLLVCICMGASLLRNALWRHEAALLEDAARKGPDNPRSFYNLGCLYADLGRYEDAVTALSRSLELYPRRRSGRDKNATGFYAHAYTVRGSAYRQLGQIDRALQDLNAAITLDPYAVSAYVQRGITLREVGWFDESMQDLAVAITLAPSHAEAYRERGRLFCLAGETDRAIEDWSRAIELQPDHAESYVERGNCLQRHGQDGPAARDYRKACDLGSAPGCDAVRRHADR
jgi:tetratricopeptide (TPR) repeat protein